MATRSKHKRALVTGANGFIGNAVAKAFVSAGYLTYGLVRKPEAIPDLSPSEIVPVFGSVDDMSFADLYKYSDTFDVIVSTTEDFSNPSHFRNVESLLVTVAKHSLSHGVRSLVMFSSGCKDYGIGAVNNPNVAPFTEESPLAPPSVLEPRANMGLKLFKHHDIFDAVNLRPTTLFGYSSSYYGPAFDIAAAAAANGTGVLEINADPNSIMHGTHVADCAAAYLAIAEAPRATIAGQCYNISAAEFETTETVSNALAKEYGLSKVEFTSQSQLDPNGKRVDIVGLLFGFSQWIGSEKIRKDTGWTDVRPLFSQGLPIYRRSYEEAQRSNHPNVQRIGQLLEARKS